MKLIDIITTANQSLMRNTGPDDPDGHRHFYRCDHPFDDQRHRCRH